MRLRMLLLTLALAAAHGCALAAYPCLARQHRGPVATLAGEVTPGTIVRHDVAYGADGSQNDLEITWDGQRLPDGARLAIYATRTDCEEFVPSRDAVSRRGACGVIGTVGGMLSPTARPCARNGTCRIDTSEVVQTSLIVANGRGNPNILGFPAMYRLWIVGDQRQAAAYRIAVTWFYGPDC